jgi:ABC-2 type transport system permease protein
MTMPLPRRELRLVLHQARFDLRAFRRNPQARVFTVVLPIVFLVIFVNVFGDRTVGPQHMRAATYYVPGLSTLAVVAASFVNLVVSVTTQRETGVLKRRRASPVPAWTLIAGRTLTAMAVSLGTLAALVGIGSAAYGVHLSAATIPAVALTAIVGAGTFCVLAYALSTQIRSADAAQPMVQALILPLYFISGVFVPSVNLPGWLHRVAELFPVEHLADGLHRAYRPGAAGVPWSDLAVLAAWAAAGLVVALRRFSWSPISHAS